MRGQIAECFTQVQPRAGVANVAKILLVGVINVQRDVPAALKIAILPLLLKAENIIYIACKRKMIIQIHITPFSRSALQLYLYCVLEV